MEYVAVTAVAVDALVDNPDLLELNAGFLEGFSNGGFFGRFPRRDATTDMINRTRVNLFGQRSLMDKILTSLVGDHRNDDLEMELIMLLCLTARDRASLDLPLAVYEVNELFTRAPILEPKDHQSKLMVFWLRGSPSAR